MKTINKSGSIGPLFQVLSRGGDTASFLVPEKYLALHWRTKKKTGDDAPVDIWSPCDLKEVGLVNDSGHRENDQNS